MPKRVHSDPGLPEACHEYLSYANDYVVDYILHLEPKNYRVAARIDAILRRSPGISAKVEERQNHRVNWIEKHEISMPEAQIRCEKAITLIHYVHNNSLHEDFKEMLSYRTVHTFLHLTFVGKVQELISHADSLAPRVAKHVSGVGHRLFLSLASELQKRDEQLHESEWKQRDLSGKPASSWDKAVGLFMDVSILVEKLECMYLLREPLKNVLHRPPFYSKPRHPKSTPALNQTELPGFSSGSPSSEQSDYMRDGLGFLYKDSKPKPQSVRRPDPSGQSGEAPNPASFEPNRSTAPSPKILELGGPKGYAWIRGKRTKRRLRDERYKIIKVLMEAGEDGLSGEELVDRSGCGGAVNTLKAMKTDADWEPIISLAGVPGGRYRLNLTDSDESPVAVGVRSTDGH